MDMQYLTMNGEEEQYGLKTEAGWGIEEGDFVSTQDQEKYLEKSVEEAKQRKSFEEEKDLERVSKESRQADTSFQSTEEKEKMDAVQEDIEFVKSFSEQRDIRSQTASEDGYMSKVRMEVEKFSEDFSETILANGEKGEDFVEGLTDALANIGKASEDYIENKDPILPKSRHKMELVQGLKDKVEAIQQAENEGNALSGLVDFWCFKLNEQSGNGQDAAGEDAGENPGSNKKNSKRMQQKRFYQGAEQFGAAGAMPMVFDVEASELKERQRGDYVDYNELIKNQKLDGIQMSENALEQLSKIKIIGFLFGISDWQQIIDPEKLLYEEKDGVVNSVQIAAMPGLADVPEKMTMEEAEKFASSLIGEDTNALEVLAITLSNANLMVNPLADAVGADAGVLLKRLKTLMLCVDAIKKGRKVSSLNRAFFR